MTRPPNKRVSRGQPIRRSAPAKKGSGCAMVSLAAVGLLAAGLALIALPLIRPHHPPTPPAWIPPRGFTTVSVPNSHIDREWRAAA